MKDNPYPRLTGTSVRQSLWFYCGTNGVRGCMYVLYKKVFQRRECIVGLGRLVEIDEMELIRSTSTY